MMSILVRWLSLATQWNTKWKHAVFWYQNTRVYIKITVAKAKISVLLFIVINLQKQQNNCSSLSNKSSFSSLFVWSATPVRVPSFISASSTRRNISNLLNTVKPFSFILKVRLKIKTKTGHFYMHMPTSCPYNLKDWMRMRPSPPPNASLDRIRHHTTFVEDTGRPSYLPPNG